MIPDIKMLDVTKLKIGISKMTNKTDSLYFLNFNANIIIAKSFFSKLLFIQ